MIELLTRTGERFKLESAEKIVGDLNDFIVLQFHDYKVEDLKWAETSFGIDLSIMNHTEDIEISSHFQQSKDQSSFHFSIPYYQQKDLMVEESLFVILTQDKVFAFMSSGLDDYFTGIYSYKSDLLKNESYQVEDLFKFHIELLADYYADITENLAKRIKQLASRVLVKKEFKESDLDVITQLNFNNLLVKESLNEFTRILTLQKKTGGNLKFNVKDKIEEELNDLSVVSDYIQFNFDRLDDLKENVSNKIELEQNKIFKMLTMITFCISLPTLIAGVYGMNFQNMPELKSNYGYFFALAAMVVSVVVPLLYFRKRKWL